MEAVINALKKVIGNISGKQYNTITGFYSVWLSSSPSPQIVNPE